MLTLRSTVLLLAATLGGAPASASEPRLIEADGTEFKVTMTDGRVLRSRNLVGTQLTIVQHGQPMQVRIDAALRDPDTRAGNIWLHSFSVQGADGAWQPLCVPDPDGRQLGFPVAGRARADGTLAVAPPDKLELICIAGAQGKCIRLGYRPWQRLDLYNACIRMMRADYCGNGTATTRDGTTIEVYDALSIQETDADPASAQDFEAGWTAQGAVCVHHARVRQNISLDRLVAACPRLRGRVGAMCTEDMARSLGARLFNRSKP